MMLSILTSTLTVGLPWSKVDDLPSRRVVRLSDRLIGAGPYAKCVYTLATQSNPDKLIFVDVALDAIWSDE